MQQQSCRGGESQFEDLASTQKSYSTQKVNASSVCTYYHQLDGKHHKNCIIDTGTRWLIIITHLISFLLGITAVIIGKQEQSFCSIVD